MSVDPFEQLRHELVAAGRRQVAGRRADGRRRPRPRPRRSLLVALAALVVAAPATAAITGLSPFGSGTTPDGSTYTTEDFVAEAGDATGPAPGSECRRVDFRDPSGTVTTRSTACRPAHSAGADDRPLAVGFTVTPGKSLLVQGTVSAAVARVTVSGVDGDIPLAPDQDGRQKFSITTTQDKPTVIAYDRSGRELSRYDVPL